VRQEFKLESVLILVRRCRIGMTHEVWIRSVVFDVERRQPATQSWSFECVDLLRNEAELRNYLQYGRSGEFTADTFVRYVLNLSRIVAVALQRFDQVTNFLSCVKTP